MIPKVSFIFSPGYNRRFKTHQDVQKRLKEENLLYPSPDEIKNYIVKVEHEWRKKENSIYKEISKITELKWNEKLIKCYVIGFGTSFADPLTVRVHKNKNDFIDMLTHELIHQIFLQNSYKTNRWWKRTREKWNKETFSAKSHILVHAVHKHVYLKIFNKNRLSKDIKKAQRTKAIDYKRAWEIVRNEGYQSILEEFKKS